MSDDKNLHNVYLGLGTNLGNRTENIRVALRKIEKEIGQVVLISTLVDTAPVGFASDNMFINCACLIQSSFSPQEILAKTQNIEREMGRINKSENKVYTDRIIDIDVLLYDDLIIDTPPLIVPHPHLHERSFVLLPLASIAPDVMHPLLHKTMKELEADLQSFVR